MGANVLLTLVRPSAIGPAALDYSPLHLRKAMTKCLAVLALFFLSSLTLNRLMAEPTGPTVHLGYVKGKPQDNPIEKFMYFVPLISPEPISVSINAGNTQSVRVLCSKCQTNGASFHSTCEFEVLGEGLQRNVFDHSDYIHQHEKELKAGKRLAYQLDAINILGSGSGSIEIEGMQTNGQRMVTEVRLHFNSHAHTSPVTIRLHDFVYRDGAVHLDNEIAAKVNTLVFYQKSGEPRMQVILASLKPENAGDSIWANIVGKIRGVVANLFIPPLTVPADGNQAMMNFGLAIATEEATFTFPFATRLRKTLQNPVVLNRRQ